MYCLWVELILVDAQHFLQKCLVLPRQWLIFSSQCLLSVEATAVAEVGSSVGLLRTSASGHLLSVLGCGTWQGSGRKTASGHACFHAEVTPYLWDTQDWFGAGAGATVPGEGSKPLSFCYFSWQKEKKVLWAEWVLRQASSEEMEVK